MKINFAILLLIGSVIFLSCKEDTSKTTNDGLGSQNQPEDIAEQNENILRVKLRVAFEKDDALELFYLETETGTYAAEGMVQKKIKGTKDFQEVEFQLPKDIYPYNIRLDFGFEKNQAPVKISECILSYNDNSFAIKGGELKNYFMFNGGVEMQSDSLTFQLKPFDLHGKEVYDPYIVGNKNMGDALMTKL